MKKNKGGYSIILSILMIGFMLVLTSGVFSLVLSENKDTKSMEYYLKAYAGAQGANELAMLKAKQNNYSYSTNINSIGNNESIILSRNPLDDSTFHKNKDVLLTFKIDATASGIINKTIPTGEFEIIPLFTTNPYKKTTDITITGLDNNVVWNILSNSGGISWIGNFDKNTKGNLKLEGSYEEKTIGDYLNQNENNYLILHNTSSLNINYTLNTNDGNFITKDKTYIISSAEIGGYKQNIKTEIETSKYLNLLKYSLFSQ